MLEGYGITLRVFNQVIVRVALLKAFYQWVVHLLSQQVLNVQIRRFWVFDRLNKATQQNKFYFFATDSAHKMYHVYQMLC